jgi:nucleoside-diphosphate-sugar epimerase
MKEAVAITGASGFLGKNLLSVIDPMRMLRFASDKIGDPSIGVQAVDLTQRSDLKSWLDRCSPTVIVHLGARTDLVGRTVEDYAANTVGVENLLSAARSLPNLRRVIFASSRMVCRIDDIPTSYDHYSPPNPYGASKVQGERMVKTADLPFEWVIVRPTSIWGPGFGIPYRNFFDQVRKRRYFHQAGYNPLKSFGYVENTVFQLMKLIEAPSDQVNRRTFYLGDYSPIAVRQWADEIHGAFGLPGSIIEVPMGVLRASAKVGDLLNWVSGQDKAPLTTFRLKNLVTNMIYPQLAELESVTGPLPVGWQEGTANTVEWLKSF